MKTKVRIQMRLTKQTLLAPSLTSAAFLCLAVVCAPLAFAVQEDKAKKPVAEKKESEDAGDKKSAKPAAKKEAEKKEVIAVVGADIITVTREKIRNGTILIEDGKIIDLGTSVDVPEGATTIDASGKIICPGFVAIDMSGVGLRTSSSSGAKYEDGLDPFDRNISLSLGVGITTGCIQIRSGSGRPRRFSDGDGDGFPTTERFPGLDPDLPELMARQLPLERDIGEYVSTCPCCGLPILPTEPITPSRPSPIRPQKSAVIKMSYGKLDGMLVRKNAFVDVTPGALTGAMNQKNWREMLGKARQYLKDQAAHEKATAAGKKEKPPKKPVEDEILQLVKGEIALRITANTVAEMSTLIQLSKELEYDLVITGAGEGWVIPDELSDSAASVVLTPRNHRRPVFGAEDRSGTWIETPRVMEEVGVPFAVKSISGAISMVGLAGRDLTSLPLEAAFAVRGGASERKALEAITIAPARMLGIDDQVGSIEVGKDADLLILNGQPLDYRTYVETAMVNGRVVYDRREAKVLPVYDR